MNSTKTTMPNLKDWVPGEQVKALVFGAYKTGKTWGAGTFPRPNFMDLDGGIAVLRNPEWVKKYGLRAIEYEQFHEKKTNSRGVVLDHNAFDDACRYFDKWMGKGYVDQFDTWVVDSATSLSEAALNKAIVLLGSKALQMASKTHEQAINTGLVYPKMQDYGSERSMVEQFVDMLLSTDKHVVLICHEKEITDDNGMLKAVTPLLTGKGVEAVCLKFDEVWNLRVRKKGAVMERYLQTVPDALRKCGSRYGIPDGTPWEWDAIKGALDNIRREQQAVTVKGQSSAPITPK